MPEQFRRSKSHSLTTLVETNDPRVLMSLMRHTNLTTTTKYIRAMQERMKDAVSGLGQSPDKILGATLGANEKGLPGQKSAENSIQLQIAKLTNLLINQRSAWEKVGGGGQIRTVDAADMSRVL